MTNPDINQLLTDSETLASIYSTSYFSQAFIPSVSGNLTDLSLCLWRHASPGNLIIEIFATDINQKPTGSALATQTITQASISSTTWSQLNVVFSSPASLTQGVRYAIVLHSTSGDGSTNYYTLDTFTNNGGENFDIYTDGKLFHSSDGATWTENANDDIAFVTGMDVIAPSPSLDQFCFGFHHYEEVILDNYFRSQTFIPSINGILQKVRLSITKPSNFTGYSITVEIRATDLSGLPTGSAISSVETILDSSLIRLTDPIAGHTIDVTFSTPPTLVSGTKYAIVISFPHGSQGYYTPAVPFPVNNYSNGQMIDSTDGIIWTPSASSSDLLFGTFMVHSTTQTETIDSDSIILTIPIQTINSDAFIGQEITQTINSDTNITATVSQLVQSDAHIGITTNQNIFSDTNIQATIQQNIQSDAKVALVTIQTINSDAHIQGTTVRGINSSAFIKLVQTKTIDSDCIIIIHEPDLKLFVVI